MVVFAETVIIILRIIWLDVLAVNVSQGITTETVDYKPKYAGYSLSLEKNFN